jgi:hypothetical protein
MGQAQRDVTDTRPAGEFFSGAVEKQCRGAP